MGSPFPGIDPFIESQCWTDFNTAYISTLRELLMPRLAPRYVAILEERVYLERCAEQPESIHEVYLEIRLRAGMRLVTIIELLSPANKRAGSDGRREYLAKREAILRSDVHLVELDFLRGGEALPMAAALPNAYGWAIVSDARSRPMADVWAIELTQPLPAIEIPLADDAAVEVELQSAFATVYERARYDLLLSYQAPLEPKLSPHDQAWVATVLQNENLTATPPSP